MEKTKDKRKERRDVTGTVELDCLLCQCLCCKLHLAGDIETEGRETDEKDLPTTRKSRTSDLKPSQQEAFWMEKMKEAAKDKQPEMAILQTCIALLKAGTLEIEKVKHEYTKVATALLLDSSLEESLQDYRECIFPSVVYPSSKHYSADLKTTLKDLYGKVVDFSTWYHDAIARIKGDNCPYYSPLQKAIQRAFDFSLILVRVYGKVMERMKFKHTVAKKLEFADYIAKARSNTILFFRDFIIIRDFHEALEKLTVRLACRYRMSVMKNEGSKKTKIIH